MRWPRWAGPVGGALALAAGLAYVALTAAEAPLLPRLMTKPVPVILLLLWVRTGPRDRLRDGVLAGLALALCGDLALVFPGERAFLAGLVLNLLAHVAYIVGFAAGRPPLRLAWIAPYALWVAGLVGWLWAGLGPMRGPVIAYAAAIALMMWRAAARLGQDPAARWGALGAVGFGLCDTLIALNRFGQPLEGVVLPTLACYWLGQWGIAAAARARPLDGPGAPP